MCLAELFYLMIALASARIEANGKRWIMVEVKEAEKCTKESEKI